MQIGLLEELNERACQAMIPSTSKRKLQRTYDRHMYKWRHLLENVFCDLKEFKKIAMPSEKTADPLQQTFISLQHLWL